MAVAASLNPDFARAVLTAILSAVACLHACLHASSSSLGLWHIYFSCISCSFSLDIFRLLSCSFCSFILAAFCSTAGVISRKLYLLDRR